MDKHFRDKKKTSNPVGAKKLRELFMKTLSNQKGASIIAVIAVILILAVMGAALVTTGSDVSVNQLQSEQALQIQQRV